MANKTVPSSVSVNDFINSVEKQSDREAAFTLLSLMEKISGSKAKMWGPSIIGFGEYHYRYESGREGDFFIMGFSPRKTAISLYILPGLDFYKEELKNLGKFKTGKSCLYVKHMADIDLKVLEKILKASVLVMNEKFEVKK